MGGWGEKASKTAISAISKKHNKIHQKNRVPKARKLQWNIPRIQRYDYTIEGREKKMYSTQGGEKEKSN